MIDFNPYKRKDVELNQQTRIENGENKILIFWYHKVVRIKNKERKLLDRSRWSLIPRNDCSSKILDNRWFMKNADYKESENYKVFDTTKWSGSKTKHALIPLIGSNYRIIKCWSRNMNTREHTTIHVFLGR